MIFNSIINISAQQLITEIQMSFAIITQPINRFLNKNYSSVLRIPLRKLPSSIPVGLKSYSYGFSTKTCRKILTSQVCSLNRDTQVHLTLGSLLLKRETSILSSKQLNCMMSRLITHIPHRVKAEDHQLYYNP